MSGYKRFITGYKSSLGGDRSKNEGTFDPLDERNFVKPNETEAKELRSFVISNSEQIRLKKIAPGGITTFSADLSGGPLAPNQIIKLEGDLTILAKVISVLPGKKNKFILTIELVPPQEEAK